MDTAPERMDDTELAALVRSEINDAASFIDDDIAPLRTKATKYYNGEKFGDEKDGRSQVISFDVRDTVHAILPSLLRVFFGSEEVVEFVPRQDEDAPKAAQATDYVRYIVNEENRGFLTFRNWFKDALIRKTGIVKVWHDDSIEVKAETYQGIDETGRAFIMGEPGVSVLSESSYLSPDMGDGQPPVTLFDLQVNRKVKSSQVRFECLPPEEFLIARNAKDIESARFTCHRTEKTASDLVAMGYTREQVEEAGSGSTLESNQERIERNPSESVFGPSTSGAMRLIPYFEAFVRVDQDGDGIAELRRICLMGDSNIVANDPADEAPFALLCPDPEPHIVIGNSVADVVMDIQRIKSQIMRLMLDSFSQTINPRTAVLEGQANMDDVLNDEVGGIIRIRSLGAVQPLETPFVAQQALPFLQVMDDVRESRTGITKASQGLASDVLQSTTKTAVAATVQAAQEHIEEIARIFAETGVKRLFKIIFRLITTHQDRAKVVRLRGKFVPVDPREWDSMMDVSVNVGLGGGTKEDKLATLSAIAEKQESILLQLGATNPLVTPAQYSYTLRKMAELSGFAEPSKFFQEVPADYQPPPQQNQAPDPAMILAQAQKQQIEADISKKAAELQLKREEMHMTDLRERYRIDSQQHVALNEQSLKYNKDVSQVNAQIALDAQQHQNQLSADAEQADLERQHQAQMAAQQQQAEPQETAQ